MLAAAESVDEEQKWEIRRKASEECSAVVRRYCLGNEGNFSLLHRLGYLIDTQLRSMLTLKLIRNVWSIR